LSAYPLKHFVEKLDHPFIQIHRSWMVNLDLVKSYDKGRGGNILMINDLSIPIAFRRKADFITKFKELQKD
jgi:two-component system LytT family response regulator